MKIKTSVNFLFCQGFRQVSFDSLSEKEKSYQDKKKIL